MGTVKSGGLISRAVREALSTLVSPQMCEQLIDRSLANHGLTAIPETGIQIGEWLEGGLRPEVETVVGPDAAELMMMQLGPMAAYAAISQPKTVARAPAPAAPAGGRARTLPPSASVRPPYDSEPDRPTHLRVDPDETDWSAFGRATASIGERPAANPFDEAVDHPLSDPAWESNPPGRSSTAGHSDDGAVYTTRPQPVEQVAEEQAVSEALPTVLAATSDKGNLEALRRYLGGTASVVHIADLVGMLDALDELSVAEPIVLIDCQRPTVHVKSVASLGEDLPRGTTVVLWGADEATWSHVDRGRTPGCRWVRCSREASTSDVGSLCSMLIG